MRKQLTFGLEDRTPAARCDLTQKMLADEAACTVQALCAFESEAQRASFTMAGRLADFCMRRGRRANVMASAARRKRGA